MKNNRELISEAIRRVNAQKDGLQESQQAGDVGLRFSGPDSLLQFLGWNKDHNADK